VTIEQESNIAAAVVVLAALAALVTLAALVVGATLAGAAPLVDGAAVVDVVDEPQAAIKSATPARTTPIRRT
jgi:hypothetical protein